MHLKKSFKYLVIHQVEIRKNNSIFQLKDYVLDNDWPGIKQMPDHPRMSKEGFRAIQ
jgi:hypothetical protein